MQDRLPGLDSYAPVRRQDGALDIPVPVRQVQVDAPANWDRVLAAVANGGPTFNLTREVVRNSVRLDIPAFNRMYGVPMNSLR